MKRAKRQVVQRAEDLMQHLVSWIALNEAIMQLSEANLQRLLNLERRHKRRCSFMIRIQQRLNRIRILDALDTIRNDAPLQRAGRRSSQ